MSDRFLPLPQYDRDRHRALFLRHWPDSLRDRVTMASVLFEETEETIIVRACGIGVMKMLKGEKE